MEKSRIRDKHPGSATLHEGYLPGVRVLDVVENPLHVLGEEGLHLLVPALA